MTFIRDTGEISDGSYIIDAKSWGIEKQNAVYFIKDEKTVLIDTGTRADARKINKYITEKLNCEKIDYIIITHSHLDHVGGLSYFIKKHNRVEILFSKKSSHLLTELKKLISKNNYEVKIRQVEEGDLLTIGEDHQLKILDTPGHSPDHISILDLKTRYLYVGDSAGAYHIGKRFSRPTAYAPDFEYKKYLNTMKRYLTMELNGIGIASYGFVKGPDYKAVLELGFEIFNKWFETIKDCYFKGLNLDAIYEVMIKKFGKSPGEIEENRPEHWIKRFLIASISGFIEFIENNMQK
ncbi:MAG: MBL fold metallo-hydrolase [Candidatus Helarchaeota archaeon]